MLIKTAMEMQRASNGGKASGSPDFSENLRPAFWNAHPWEYVPSEHPSPQYFPDSDLLMHLIQLFFDNVNIHAPLLHRPTFERFVRDNLHLNDHLFGASVLAVCAVASRYSNDARVILEGTDSLYSSGWQWFRQIKPFQRPISQVPSIYELQTYLGTSTPEACWPLIGVGIRFAQDVGAHRRRSNRKLSVEGELWNRAFWVLICFDTILCSFLGRPRATNCKDYDLDLPMDCDDEYWRITDTTISFEQPPGKPSRIASFITYLKLMEILDAAQRTIYSVNRSTRLLERPLDDHKVVTELDSELNKWVDSVPDHLRWDPQKQDPVFFEQSAMLYSAYYHIQILIHRPFIPSPMRPSPLPFPSLAICTNAARSCIHLMELESRKGFMPLPQIQMALTSSAIVLLLNVWAGKLSGFSGDPGKDMQGVVNSLNVMRTYETRWLSAGRMW
ncbi:hypothetical protein L208DRAFT_637341 [Tricholoma matsutake]|nr:hypothetical protein L208DRAFT_637341 [Tricholoma matsutake 945]